MTHDSINHSCPTFCMAKVHTCYCGLVRGSHMEKGMSGVRQQLNYCGWRPQLGDPCRKWNCILKFSDWHITAVTSPTNCECSVYGCVITCTIWIYRGSAVESKNVHIFQSLHRYLRNSEFWGNLFSSLCHILCAYYAHVKTSHKLGYIYTYWRDLSFDNLLVGMVFMWAKVNVDFGLFVFLVSLVAQWAIRSLVNVSVKVVNFPVCD